MKSFIKTLSITLAVFIAFINLSQAEPNVELQNAQRQLEILDPSVQGNEALREVYSKIVSTYQQAEKSKQRIARLKVDLQQIPSDITALKKQLDTNKSQLSKINFKKKSRQKLESELTQLQSKQLELQQEKSRIQNQITNHDKRPVELRDKLAVLNQAILNNHPTVATQANQILFDAQFLLRNLETQAIELELLISPQQSERDRLTLNQLKIDLKAVAHQVRQYQDKILALRQAETDRLLAETDAKEAVSDNKPTLIKALIKQNATLSEQLRTRVASSTKTVEHRRILEQQLSLTQQSYDVIQQQLALSKNSFGIELRNFSQRFAAPKTKLNTKDNINQIRLKNIELNQLQLNLTTQSLRPQNWTDQSLQEYQQLQDRTMNLITNLRRAYSRELDELSKVLTIESQIQQQFNRRQSLLTEYLLWLPSVPAVDGQWFNQVKNSTQSQWEYSVEYITKLSVQPLNQWLRWLILFAVVSIVSILCFNYQKNHEKIWSRQIGNVIHDKLSRSIRMLIIAPIICFPIPLFIWILLERVLFVSSAETHYLNSLLALAFWCYCTLLLWLRRPYGLLISHLDVPEELCIKLKKLLHPLFILGAPMTWALLYFDRFPSLELHSGLGRLVFILLAFLAGAFWAALWKVAPQINHTTDTMRWWQQAKLWLAALVLTHIVLIAAALLGYLFTGSVIMALLLAITIIFYGIFTLFRLGMRWLLIAERRLAFKRARARRSEILAARENNEEEAPLKENYIDLQSISDQARILLKATCLSLLLVSLWLLLKNLLPSLDVLDNFVLWRNDITTASGVISENITLRSVITSIFVIGLSILAAYNLPGLLELLVLKHIHLTPGTSYAITTITRYLLIIISIIAGASQIGVEWAKLQWLLAAMGVGLGFGLQEIVANFVSGIIILFEKPVRIGDTVTIGGVTGRVTKIQIRATTISDWDRKEVIIPNKTFVTDQLINWSLSDAITRVVINVGVARGSDTELVQQLIRTAAINNIRVLKDPTADVFFTAFGDSTLNFELRFFVDNLADRNLAIHEINQHIDQSFKQHDISIAFPQLDVHLHRT